MHIIAHYCTLVLPIVTYLDYLYKYRVFTGFYVLLQVVNSFNVMFHVEQWQDVVRKGRVIQINGGGMMPDKTKRFKTIEPGPIRKKPGVLKGVTDAREAHILKMAEVVEQHESKIKLKGKMKDGRNVGGLGGTRPGKRKPLGAFICNQCGKIFRRLKSRNKRSKKLYCNYECYYNFKRRPKHEREAREL